MPAKKCPCCNKCYIYTLAYEPNRCPHCEKSFILNPNTFKDTPFEDMFGGK
jgi:hypothetical protein